MEFSSGLVKKSFIILPLLVILILISFTVFITTPNLFFPPSKTEENVTINLAYAGAVLEAVTYIANDYGFFEKEGVNVELHNVIPTLALPGLVAGQYQISMFASPNLVSYMTRDAPVVMIAHGSYIPPNPQGITMDGIIVRKGLDVKSPQDLKGKIVGIPAFGSVLDIHFKAFLKNNNINVKDFEYQEIPPPQVGSLMYAGRLDVYIGAQPHMTSLVSAGVADVYKYNDWIPQNHFSSTYTTSREFLENHPKTLEKFIKALQKAEVFMKNNPDAYYETVSKYAKVNISIVKEVPIPAPVGGDKLSINMKVLEETQDLQLQNGFIDKKVDFGKYVDARFVGTVS